MSSPLPSASATRASSFEADAAQVLAQMSLSMRRLIAQLPGSPRKASDVHKALGVEAPLGWKVFRVANSAEPLTAGAYVPQAAAIRRVIRSARKAGVDNAVLTGVEDSAAAFERLVLVHADSRESFDSMISDYASDGSREAVSHRRAAFKANAHIFGLQAFCSFGALIVAPPSAGVDELDAVTVTGRMGLRQVRRSSELMAESELRTLNKDQARPHEPLVRVEGMLDDFGLIPEFCSRPLPRIERYETPDGYARWRLYSHGLGKAAELTYSAGKIMRRGMAAPKVDQPATYVGRFLFPMEVAFRDMIVHEDFVSGCHVFAKTYGGLQNSRDHRQLEDTDLLPEQADMVYIGRGLEATTSADCPWMDKLVELAFRTMGWPSDRYHVFRCRIEYPVMHSIVRLHVAKGSSAGTGGARAMLSPSHVGEQG